MHREKHLAKTAGQIMENQHQEISVGFFFCMTLNDKEASSMFVTNKNAMLIA